MNNSKKEIKNAGWIIGGRIGQMIISLMVNLLTARYLGPSNYGLINYANAYVAFFSSLCTLGINSVIVKEFVDKPDEQGSTIGTALGLKLLASTLSVCTILAVVGVMHSNDPIAIRVVLLCSLSLVFHIFETFNYWFQNMYNSKVPAMAALGAYAVTAAYKVVLLVLQKDVEWFAFSMSVDYIVVAIFLLISYRRYRGPALRFSLRTAKSLLSKSHHYILSGMMIAIYGQTDKMMLKVMMDDAYVGYYSAATTICSMWTFVLSAIITSMYPTILRMHKVDQDGFIRKNKQLYAIIFYLSCFVSLFFMIGGKYVVLILYGGEYLNAVNPLRIITWYTAFSYLGVARDAWIVCENKQRYLKYIYLSAAILNVGLNAVLIPCMQASGAALASLITQIATSIALPFLIRELRPNSKMMVEAIMLKNTLGGK